MSEELWDCSECGGRFLGENPPAVCPVCGTAGAIFVEAERDVDDQPEQQWLLEGLQRGQFRES